MSSKYIHELDTMSQLGSGMYIPVSSGNNQAYKTTLQELNTLYRVDTFLTNTASLNFPSIDPNNQSELYITVNGAEIGDSVNVSPSGAIEANLGWCGYIPSGNIVTVRLYNTSSGVAINPANRPWRATVFNI